MRKLQVVGLAVAVLTTAATLVATTWTPSEVTCPICHTKNKFRTIMSYGSYVYGWPSKFQMVYWPSTDESSVYTCKECHLSAFMWDFEKIPADIATRPRARHNLDQIAWKTVPRDTPVTLEYFVRDYVAHMKHHLAQIPS